jgi:hypothetical protein
MEPQLEKPCIGKSESCDLRAAPFCEWNIYIYILGPQTIAFIIQVFILFLLFVFSLQPNTTLAAAIPAFLIWQLPNPSLAAAKPEFGLAAAKPEFGRCQARVWQLPKPSLAADNN